MVVAFGIEKDLVLEESGDVEVDDVLGLEEVEELDEVVVEEGQVDAAGVVGHVDCGGATADVELDELLRPDSEKTI